MEITITTTQTFDLVPHGNVILHWKKNSRVKAEVKIWTGEVNFDHEREVPLNDETWKHLRKALQKQKTDVFRVKNRFFGFRFYTIRGMGDKYYLTEIKHPKLTHKE